MLPSNFQTTSKMALYKYAWSFSTGYNPTELSCVATSLASAREQIVERLRHITAARAEYESLTTAPRPYTFASGYALPGSTAEIAATKAAEAAAATRRNEIRESVDIDAFIGPYTAGVMDFAEGLMVHDDPEGPMTLRDFILHTDPKVTPFQCVSLRVALDG